MTEGRNQFQDYRRFLDLTSQSPPLSDLEIKDLIHKRNELNLLLSEKLRSLNISSFLQFETIYSIALSDGKNPRKFKIQWNVTPGKIRHAGPEIIKIKNQIKDITQKLIATHSRLILRIAQQYRPNRNCTMEEILHEGVKGCAMALDIFDPDRGIQFQTFASPHIRVRMSRVIKKARYGLIESDTPEGDFDKSLIIFMNPEAGELLACSVDMEENYWHKEVMNLLMPYIELLPDRQREIVKSTFGVGCEGTESQVLIGKKMGIKNPQFVYQLKEEGLRKLRSILPPRIKDKLREEFLAFG